jgi:hypothetical protein
MPVSAAPGVGASGPLDVPRDTTPTYEPELLVSGIVLVGLFQLPGVFTGVAERYGPHFTGVAAIAFGRTLQLVATAAVYALAACFVAHLALRGFWVALVGVDSIFPDGVRWDRLREAGPIATAHARERERPLRHYIARLDNAATLVFTGGFLAAASILVGVAGAALVAAALAAVGALAPGAPSWVALALGLAVLLPLAVGPMLDVALGARLAEGSRARRVLGAAVRANQAVVPRSVAAVSRVLATNVDKRAYYGLLVVAAAAAFAGAAAAGDGAVPGAGAYRFFDGASEARGLVADFYEDDRGERPRSDAAPSIASEVAAGPYLRVFIPYVPRRHNDALPRTCPGLRPPRRAEAAGEDTAGLTAVVACAARVHRLALDGRPLAGVPLRLFEDPKAGRRGFVAQVPVADLAAGEHALTVWPATANGRPPARAPWTITFWR